MALNTEGKVDFNDMMKQLEGGVNKAGTDLNAALDKMNADANIGPEQLLSVQRLTSIWTTYVSQVTTMGKAVADSCKSIVRNYN